MNNEKLKRARLDRRWSAAEAARRVGVSRVTYMRWENGEQAPHDSTLIMACSAFKLSPELLGFAPEPKRVQARRKPSELVLLDTGMGRLTLDAGVGRSLYGELHDVLAFIWQSHGCSILELQTQVAKVMENLETTANTPLESRRNALRFLAGLPVAVAALVFTGSDSAFMPVSEVLPLYVTGVPACWKLFYGGEWQKAREVLPSYISQLTAIVQTSSQERKLAASLLSQSHQLASIISLEDGNFGTSLVHSKQALTFGELAEDPNLQAAALMRHSDILFWRDLPTVEINQQAIQFADQISPLLKSRLYSDWGACLADIDQKQESLRYLGMAQEAYPDDFAYDPGFAYTHTTRYVLYLNETLAHLRLGSPQDAFSSISKASAYVPEAVSARRLELVKYSALASVATNDMEQALAHFDNMANLASQHSSMYWYGELAHLYKHLQKQWPAEARVRQLARNAIPVE